MNQRKASVVLQYLAQFIHILSALFYTPIMLRLIGQSEYGTYQLVDSVVSYLSLVSLGFGSSYVRYYFKYKEQGSEEDVKKLNGMFLIVFSIMSAIVIIAGTVMIINIHSLLGTGLTEHEYSIATTLMKFMVFNMALSLITSVFDCIVTAHERFVFLKLLGRKSSALILSNIEPLILIKA